MKKLLFLVSLLVLGVSWAANRMLVFFSEKNQPLENAPREYVYLNTDKTLYNPGDIIWFTAFVRKGYDLQPTDLSEVINIEFYNGQDEMQHSFKLTLENGFTKGEIALDPDLPGGEYRIRAYTLYQLEDTASYIFEKKIQISTNTLPQMLLSLNFEEKGLQPGMYSYADFQAKDLEGNPIANKNVYYEISLDDFFKQDSIRTNGGGSCKIPFHIPNGQKSNFGSLNVVVKHRGVTESINRNIPLSSGKLQVEFYPEGGDWIAGHSTKIAFASVDENGNPVTIKGKLKNNKDEVLTEFVTYHDGMGSFQWKATETSKLHAEIIYLEDTLIFPMPEIKASGATVQLNKNNSGKINIAIRNNISEEMMVTLSTKEKNLKTIPVKTISGSVELTNVCEDLPTGIIRVTLLKNSYEPIAERLFFNEGKKKISVNIENDKPQYQPRSKVKTKIKITDETGAPVKTDFALSVIDEKNLKLADDKQGNILSAFLLESELKGKIKEPAFYFDSKESKSAEALDLLLLTRGWRKFTWKEEQKRMVEKTKIKGKIINSFGVSDEEFYKNTSLKLANSKEEIKVDEKGTFEISGIDLSVEPYLTASYKRKKVHFKLTEFYDSLLLEFTNRQQYRYVPAHTSYRTGAAGISGRLFDHETGEALPFVTVVVMDKYKDEVKYGSYTDFDGYFMIKNIHPGTYRIKIAYIGYETVVINDVNVFADKTTYINKTIQPQYLELNEVVISSNSDSKRRDRKRDKQEEEGITMRESSTELESVIITSYTTPLISDERHSASTVTREYIAKIPGRSISSIASVTSEIYQAENLNKVDLHMRGSRADGVLYFIDGVKTTSAPNIPASAIDEVHIITGGIPANYGDVTGGVILITTRDFYDGSNHYYSYSQERDYSDPDIFYQNQNGNSVFRKGREFPKIEYGDNRKNSLPDERTTLFYSGNVTTNENGEAEFEYYTNDQITNFKITCEGIGNGIPAIAETSFFTQDALTVEAKFPSILNIDDEIIVPVIIRNNSEENMNVRINIEADSSFQYTGQENQTLLVASNSYKEINMKLKGKYFVQNGEINIRAESGKEFFTLQKSLSTKFTGFQTKKIYSDASEQVTFTPEINDSFGQTIRASVEIFPSQLSQIIDATQQMLKEPHGCFEQVSSSTYPNLMVLNLLKSSDNSNSKLEADAKKYIESGYKQLAAYETPEKGFSLWGRAPASIPLTAFGLMEFTQMKSYISGVDEDMLLRTRNFLLERRDGKGKFNMGSTQINESTYSKFDSSAHCYIVWALATAGLQKEIELELETAEKIALESKDSYRLALTALSYQTTGQKEKSENIIGKLKELQATDGCWMSNGFSIMHSGTLKLETTALALMALMKNPEENKAQIMKGIKFISKSKSAYYGFGSTQATGLVIQALAEFQKHFKDQMTMDSFTVTVNDTTIQCNLSEIKTNEIFSRDISKLMHSGKNTIAFQFKPDSWIPDYQASISYLTALPVNNDPMLSISTTLANSIIEAGKQTELKINIRNDKSEIARYPLATIEIPTGMSVPFHQLVALKESRQIDHYEIQENLVVLYLPDLPAQTKKDLSLYLKAEIKGIFTTSANSIYPYYDINKICWNRGFTVNIK